MDAELYARATNLFHQAVELPAPERSAFVEANCCGDASLKESVLDMLAMDSEGDPFFERDLGEIASQVLEIDADLAPSSEFGPYRLVEILGQGGMGVVWLAERADAGKQVAIKFLLHAGLSPLRSERFRREIRTLARLEHPFIARFYDAGVLDDRTPWLVMEFVKGERIDEYCGKRQLSILDRLRLFRSVCEAVRYAHAQAILHRDLKPSNILVAEDGTPRLLDFGIAKEVDSVGDPDDSTSPSLRFLSWDYAAPEWVLDGNQGLYTDVYSLGVILYQLITGRLPFDRSKIPQGEFAAYIAANDPEKPSLAIQKDAKPAHSKSAIRKSDRSDLDLLCLRAMHRDAAQRYASVEALIRDLDHYLRNEPLEARPDSIRYRISKFLNRNRRPALAAAAVLAILAGLIVFYTVRLAKARNAELAEAARTIRTQQFMLNMLGASDQKAAPSTDLRVITLLDHAVQEADTLSADPAAQSDLYENLGKMYDSLGQYPKAEKLLTLALDTRKRAQDDVKMAGILVQLGIVKADEGIFDDAEESERNAYGLLSRHLPDDEPRVLAARSALGTVVAEYGDFRRAIPLLEPLVQRQPDGTASDYSLSESLSSLAICDYSIGKLDLADNLNRRALDLDRRLFGATHPQVADDLMTAGMTKAAVSQDAEAESDYRQAIAIEKAWYGPGHPTLADYELLLGAVLVDEGKNDEAESLLRQTVETYLRVYGPEEGHLAKPLQMLGRIETREGKFAQAEADLTRAVTLALPVYGKDGYEYAMMSAELGELYRRERHYDRANAILSQAVQSLKINRSPGPINMASAQLSWGRTLLALKRFHEAEQQLTAAYLVFKSDKQTPAADLQKIREDMIALYTALKEPDKVKTMQTEMGGTNTVPNSTAQPK